MEWFLEQAYVENKLVNTGRLYNHLHEIDHIEVIDYKAIQKDLYYVTIGKFLSTTVTREKW